MNKASGIITQTLTLISNTLGATYAQHVRSFAIESLPAHGLENRYSVRFEEITEDEAKIIGKLVVSRNLVLTITYRTFQSANDSKADAIVSMAYANEEALMLAIRTNQFTSGVHGQVLAVEGSTIEPFLADNESFIKNEIRFRIRYAVESI